MFTDSIRAASSICKRNELGEGQIPITFEQIAGLETIKKRLEEVFKWPNKVGDRLIDRSNRRDWHNRSSLAQFLQSLLFANTVTLIPTIYTYVLILLIYPSSFSIRICLPSLRCALDNVPSSTVHRDAASRCWSGPLPTRWTWMWSVSEWVDGSEGRGWSELQWSFPSRVPSCCPNTLGKVSRMCANSSPGAIFDYFAGQSEFLLCSAKACKPALIIFDEVLIGGTIGQCVNY